MSSEIGLDFEPLATYLGFKKPEIDGFHVDHPHRLENRIFYMLWTWRTRTSQRKVEDLANALYRCKRADLAEQLTGERCFIVVFTLF